MENAADRDVKWYRIIEPALLLAILVNHPQRTDIQQRGEKPSFCTVQTNRLYSIEKMASLPELSDRRSAWSRPSSHTRIPGYSACTTTRHNLRAARWRCPLPAKARTASDPSRVGLSGVVADGGEGDIVPLDNGVAGEEQARFQGFKTQGGSRAAAEVGVG
jgi:hypothetical protein